MVIILNIDTASEHCSVGISKDGRNMASRSELVPNRHASMLTELIGDVLSRTGFQLSELQAVAVNKGPGSYTGLRIGAGLAKGLCYGLGLPLIGVSALQALASQLINSRNEPDAIYVPMIDARRDDVYLGIFDAQCTCLTAERFATIGTDLNDILAGFEDRKIFFGGSGAWKAQKYCLNTGFGIIIENVICEAQDISLLSYNYFNQNRYEDNILFEPNYLKEFEGNIRVK